MATYTQSLNMSSGETFNYYVDTYDTYNVHDLDMTHIMNWIKNNYTYPRWRIYVLFPDEKVKYEIPIEDIQIGGSFNENYQNGQRRSLSFSLYNEDGKYSPNINVFWAGTRLRVDRGIQMSDGTVLWVQSGIFIVTQAQNSLSFSQKIVQITAKDKFSLFEDKTGTLDSSYEVPAGSDVQQVIRTILLTDNGDGSPLDSRPMVYHSSLLGKTVQVAINKSAGETLGSILLELATQLSAEIFYNAQGLLTIIPVDEVSLDINKPIIFECNEDQGDINQLDFTFDMNAITNRIVVIGSSVNGGAVSATAVNDDPGSPLCYQRIGYRTGSVINDSNITTNILAQERAQYELRKTLILQSSTSVNVLFNPLLSVNNLITITSEFFGLIHERFLIQSISCPLSYSGEMSITVTNIKNLPTLI